MKEDGGPAFPAASDWTPEGMLIRGGEGMSLRDYFAAAALQGLLADNLWNPKTGEIGARICFAWADAMLAERAK